MISSYQQYENNFQKNYATLVHIDVLPPHLAQSAPHFVPGEIHAQLRGLVISAIGK